MAVEPPQHLSQEARRHLLDPPEPLVGLDATDVEAVAALRADVHPEWMAFNDEINGPWCHREETIAGVPVVRFAANRRHLESEEIIVHLHGGAYFLGSPMTNAVVAVPVAQRTGLPVVSVDYRLAPEHRCPAAVEDAVAVATALGARGRLAAMFGESAGGGLAVATAVALRDAGEPMPGCLGLMSPWVDLTCSGDTYQTMLAADPDFPDPDGPPNWAAAYAGDAIDDPRASPLFADLTGLPPTLIQVGGREVLLSDACRLHAALSDAGVASTLDIWDGLWHVWQLHHHIPEAMQAFDELARFLTGDTSWS